MQGEGEGEGGVRLQLVQRWVHSVEEDTAQVMVYRPAGFDFPASRTRAGFRQSFDFRADGTCVVVGIGRGDGQVDEQCRWELAGDAEPRIEIRTDDGPLGTLHVKDVGPDRLLLHKR